MYWAC
jgi:hypothetical protein